jgi:hypothetical protein
LLGRSRRRSTRVGLSRWRAPRSESAALHETHEDAALGLGEVALGMALISAPSLLRGAAAAPNCVNRVDVLSPGLVPLGRGQTDLPGEHRAGRHVALADHGVGIESELLGRRSRGLRRRGGVDVAAFGSAPAERAATLAMKTRARKAGFAVISFVAHQVQPRRHPDRLRPAGRLWPGLTRTTGETLWFKLSSQIPHVVLSLEARWRARRKWRAMLDEEGHYVYAVAL